MSTILLVRKRNCMKCSKCKTWCDSKLRRGGAHNCFQCHLQPNSQLLPAWFPFNSVVFPLVYFRFINPKYIFVRRLVGVLFGYVVTIGHFEVLPETGSVLCRISLWDFQDPIPSFIGCYDVKSARESGSLSCPQSNSIVQFDITPT